MSAAVLKLVIYANIQTSKLQVLMQRDALKCHMEEIYVKVPKRFIPQKSSPRRYSVFSSSFFLFSPYGISIIPVFPVFLLRRVIFPTQLCDVIAVPDIPRSWILYFPGIIFLIPNVCISQC